jgi:hypothetical protein
MLAPFAPGPEPTIGEGEENDLIEENPEGEEHEAEENPEENDDEPFDTMDGENEVI